jgi:hypothetical protein
LISPSNEYQQSSVDDTQVAETKFKQQKQQNGIRFERSIHTSAYLVKGQATRKKPIGFCSVLPIDTHELCYTAQRGATSVEASKRAFG